MAIASDSPFLQYLSFYHVMEYHFETVFQDDLVERVRTRITQPDFSYRRKADIRGLVNEVSKSLKTRGEGAAFSEQEALKLTLNKFVSTPELLEEMREYDAPLVEYYKTHTVSFCEGDRVDLEGADPTQVLGSITRRVYKTRNALVHSKESEKGRYRPFDHDPELAKEIPLLRFIAEMVILKSSELIS
jgi:hypothetical protein